MLAWIKEPRPTNAGRPKRLELLDLNTPSDHHSVEEVKNGEVAHIFEHQILSNVHLTIYFVFFAPSLKKVP